MKLENIMRTVKILFLGAVLNVAAACTPVQSNIILKPNEKIFYSSGEIVDDSIKEDGGFVYVVGKACSDNPFVDAKENAASKYVDYISNPNKFFSDPNNTSLYVQYFLPGFRQREVREQTIEQNHGTFVTYKYCAQVKGTYPKNAYILQYRNENGLKTR